MEIWFSVRCLENFESGEKNLRGKRKICEWRESESWLFLSLRKKNMRSEFE